MKRFRKKKRLWLLMLLLFLSAVTILIPWKLRPAISRMAKARAANRASYLINEAVQEQLQKGGIAYDRMVMLEKNTSGEITALKTNIAEMNRLKSQILVVVDQMLLGTDIHEMGIPLGSLFLPEFFSGSGPRLPVKVMMISSSDADFRSIFSEAGINQTSHQIVMDISLTMTILTPVGAETVQVSSPVLIAETIIVGDVPKEYVNVK